MAEWKEYTGSDKQIAEIRNSKNGFITLPDLPNLNFDGVSNINDYLYKDKSLIEILQGNYVTHYLICNPHPRADMICQQSRTGQPVWIMYLKELMVLRPGPKVWRKEIIVTTTPDWNIPNAEYSFTEFKEEV